MKKLISYFLVAVMLIAVMPLSVFAEPEATYLDVDYSEKITVGTIEYDYINVNDPYISVDLAGWGGYAQGYTVSLKAKQQYRFTVTVSSADAYYIDRAVALMSNSLDGDEYVDIIDYNTNYVYETSVSVSLDASVETAGDYKLLLWGYCEDSANSEINGSDKTSIVVEVEEVESYIDMDYETIAIDSSKNFEIDINAKYFTINNYSGYVKGFKANLTAGKYYRISSDISVDDALYITNGIFAYAEIDGGSDDLLDWTAYNNDSSTDNSYVTIYCETSGTYYFLAMASASDDEKEIFGSKTSVTVELEEFEHYASVDYSKKLTLGKTESVECTSEGPSVLVFDTFDLGYALGFTVELEADTIYSLVSNIPGDHPSVYQTMMIFKSDLTGDYHVDNVEYKYDTSGFSFYCAEAGEYKILLLVNVYDSDGNDVIANEGVSAEVRIRETETTVVDIYNKDDLNSFAIKLSEDTYEAEALNVVLHADIDMSGEEWSSPSNYYSAIVFDGKGYEISGLCDSLFGYTNGVMMFNDLSIDFTYNFDNDAETLEDFGGFVDYNNRCVVFKKCSAVGDVDIVCDYSDDNGGFVGDAYKVYLYDCTSKVDFDLTENDAYSIGGFVGYCRYATVENSSWNGTITFRHGYLSSCGGIIGDVSATINAKDSYAKGSITFVDDVENEYYADGACIGGFVGYIEDFSLLENCYADMDIYAPAASDVGGFVGEADEANVFLNCYSEGSINAYLSVGGFLGESNCCGGNTFINCYTIVDVTATDGGGFIGEFYYGDSFVNCYTSGDFKLQDPEYSDEIGSFFGEGVAETPDVIFHNCFVYDSGLPVGGYYDEEYCAEDVVFDGLTEVDFNDKDAVAAMTEALNKVSKELKYATEYNVMGWGGENSDGGPIHEEITYVLGDVDSDGKVTADDYILLKRVYFGTAKLETIEDTDTVVDRSDVDFDGKITADDYILLKRVYFGMAQLG